MDIKKVIGFLREIEQNNNRSWFQEHKEEYLEVKKEFETDIAKAIARIAEFDRSVAHVMVKDATYRFYRDTRFSPDKSPYKNHFGAFINARSKKSLRGGYYIHIEPDHCLLAVGNYYLPTNILTSCRNEIIVNEAEWRLCVESRAFQKYYGAPEDAGWESPQGFGLSKLKTCPTGFPRNHSCVRYLRLKDYCAWHRVEDSFFEGSEWFDEMAKIFIAGKSMMDFTNAVIDDYE